MRPRSLAHRLVVQLAEHGASVPRTGAARHRQSNHGQQRYGSVQSHAALISEGIPRRPSQTPTFEGKKSSGSAIAYIPGAVDLPFVRGYIATVKRWLGPLLLFVCSSAWAQLPTQPGPLPFAGNRGIPGPGNNIQVPAPGGAPNSVPSDLDQVRLQFPNSDITPILKFYEQLTNKHIVADNTVVGNVTIDISSLVPREEAIRIIETSLYLNGFALVPTEGDIVKVIGVGKNPRAYGVNIYSDISQIPDNVSVVSVVFQLQYADSKDIQAVINAYNAGGDAFAAAIPLPGAIIVTESTVMLRNIAKIIAAADVPPAEVVSRFYPLQRANAKDVVDKLTKLFDRSLQAAGGNAGGGPSTAPPGRIPGQPPIPQVNPGSLEIPASLSGLTEDTIIVGKIKVDSDERTNRIHVVTRPVNLPFIEQLLAEFDSDIQFGEPVKYPLKFVSASDVLDVVVKAITEPGTKPEGETGETTPTRNAQPTNNTTASPNGEVNGGGDSGSGVNVTEGLEEPEKDITPKAVILGNTKIIADPRENTIIVLGNDEVKRKIFTLLAQLDVRAPQVMLSTVIGEFTLNNDSNYGVDYLLHYPAGPLASLIGTGTTGSTLPDLVKGHGFGATNFTGSPISSSLASAVGAGNGFTAAIGAVNSLDVIVNALESTGRFHITNTPMVYASNNKKAIIVSGQEIAIPTNTLSNVNTSGVVGSTAAVQSSVEYKQVALQLEVVPLINADREVSLDILQKLDSPSGSTQNVGGSNIPTITTRYLRTNVSIPNKATIVLGGLITRTTSGTNSSIPLLGRIPILGYLFGNRAKQSDRSELVVLIRPVVTTNPSEMADESHSERRRLLMEPDVDTTIAPPEKGPAKAVNFHYEDSAKPN